MEKQEPGVLHNRVAIVAVLVRVQQHRGLRLRGIDFPFTECSVSFIQLG